MGIPFIGGSATPTPTDMSQQIDPNTGAPMGQTDPLTGLPAGSDPLTGQPYPGSTSTETTDQYVPPPPSPMNLGIEGAMGAAAGAARIPFLPGLGSTALTGDAVKALRGVEGAANAKKIIAASAKMPWAAKFVPGALSSGIFEKANTVGKLAAGSKELQSTGKVALSALNASDDAAKAVSTGGRLFATPLAVTVGKSLPFIGSAISGMQLAGDIQEGMGIWFDPNKSKQEKLQACVDPIFHTAGVLAGVLPGGGAVMSGVRLGLGSVSSGWDIGKGVSKVVAGLSGKQQGDQELSFEAAPTEESSSGSGSGSGGSGSSQQLTPEQQMQLMMMMQGAGLPPEFQMSSGGYPSADPTASLMSSTSSTDPTASLVAATSMTDPTTAALMGSNTQSLMPSSTTSPTGATGSTASATTPTPTPTPVI